MTSTNVLIWTRSVADWQVDATTILTPVPAHRVFHIPCLALAVQTPKTDNFSCDYVVFTSANAVRFGLAVENIAKAVLGAREIFTHGEATATALRQRGLKPNVAPVRTAAELCEWLETKLPPQATLGLPCAAEPAWPMDQELGKKGFKASNWICYETVAGATTTNGKALSAQGIADLISSLNGVIAFASPSAVRGFAKVFMPELNRLHHAIIATTIGPSTQAAAAAHFEIVKTATTNSLPALVQLSLDNLYS